MLCFYRRSDLPLALLQQTEALAQQEASQRAEGLNDEQMHQLRHRELFMSRNPEVLPATHIRGKCAVTMHSHHSEAAADRSAAYFPREDGVFYSRLVYDPVNKTLKADRRSIRVGEAFQATVPLKPGRKINVSHAFGDVFN